MIMSLTACMAGFFLDFIFGDPVWLYHPVRFIGKGISIGERLLRKREQTGEQAKEGRLIAVGAILWVCIAGLSFLMPLGILILAQKLHPILRFVLETFWCYQIVAARSLCKESGRVYERLKEGDLPGARGSPVLKQLNGKDDRLTDLVSDRGLVGRHLKGEPRHRRARRLLHRGDDLHRSRCSFLPEERTSRKKQQRCERCCGQHVLNRHWLSPFFPII